MKYEKLIIKHQYRTGLSNKTLDGALIMFLCVWRKYYKRRLMKRAANTIHSSEWINNDDTETQIAMWQMPTGLWDLLACLTTSQDDAAAHNTNSCQGLSTLNADIFQLQLNF